MYKTRVGKPVNANSYYPKFIIRGGNFDDLEVVSDVSGVVLSLDDNFIEPIEPVPQEPNYTSQTKFNSFYGTLGDKTYVIAVEVPTASVAT